jgi:hypothetical protein
MLRQPPRLAFNPEGVALLWPTATFPTIDAGTGLLGLLFPEVIELSGDEVAELVNRPD